MTPFVHDLPPRSSSSVALIVGLVLIPLGGLATYDALVGPESRVLQVLLGSSSYSLVGPPLLAAGILLTWLGLRPHRTAAAARRRALWLGVLGAASILPTFVLALLEPSAPERFGFLLTFSFLLTLPGLVLLAFAIAVFVGSWRPGASEGDGRQQGS